MQPKAYLGIDVSKGYADFVLLDEQCQIVEDFFQLSDTSADRKKLKQLIEQWKKQGFEQLYCGVESTGGYENNWHSFLKGLQSSGGVWVSRLNAKAVKAVSDGSLKRTITDAVSAHNIASYLIKFPEKVDYGLRVSEPGEHFKEGRQFLTCLHMWIKQKVQLGNQLEKLLYQNLPEMLVYCRNGVPTWMLQMLIKYPSLYELNKAGEAKISKIHGISKEKAVAILKKITGIHRATSKTIEHLIGVTATEVLHQQALIVSGKTHLYTIYKDDPSVKMLCDIKGIGPDTAVGAVLEIEDVTRFESVKKITSYFGVHPCFKQSGDGLWGNHMSKKGRGFLRSVLYMSALSAVRYNPLFKELYARFRGKGMSHKQAAGVVMHKMLRVIYGVLKSGKAFDPDIERKRGEEGKQKQQKKEKEFKEEKKSFEQKRHRFQSNMEKAPISNRKQKAIKKQLASQTSTEANTGSPTANANI